MVPCAICSTPCAGEGLDSLIYVCPRCAKLCHQQSTEQSKLTNEFGGSPDLDFERYGGDALPARSYWSSAVDSVRNQLNLPLNKGTK